MTNDGDRPFSQTFVTAFARGLRVIQAFEGNRGSLALPEIAVRAGVDRAVARRSLLTLIELGFARYENKRYQLTPAILRLGYSFLSHAGLDGTLQPYVEDVARTIGVSCSVTILDGLETVSIAHAPSPTHRMGFLSKPGTRMPAYVMTSGRVLLSSRTDEEITAALLKMDLKLFTQRTRTNPAELLTLIKGVRQAGYASIDSELEDGLLSIAVPIRDRRGDLVASLNVSSSVTRTTLTALCAASLPVMLQTAQDISHVLP